MTKTKEFSKQRRGRVKEEDSYQKKKKQYVGRQEKIVFDKLCLAKEEIKSKELKRDPSWRNL